MREIKFKAWDKEENRWAGGKEWGGLEAFGLDFEGNICVRDEVYGDGGRIYFANEQTRYILMQYTGLKDKNGVEIYEGDILSPKAYLKKHGNQVVEHCCEGSCSGFVLSGELMFDECEEVIGNIYENPELLKES